MLNNQRMIWRQIKIGIGTLIGMNIFGHSTESASSANLARTEVRWGDLDMEWAALFTCSFLRHDSDQEWIDEIGSMQNGVHLIQGFATTMYIADGQGQTYYDHFTGSGVFTCGVGCIA
ncbi:DUF6345 domain-containing protein [Tepidibacillus infernus]|uniref:DUF6345 domain-containing protein n=1 Tax=Tepidibacillus infernus TaxID=1806172 RepID=UPI003B72F54A